MAQFLQSISFLPTDSANKRNRKLATFLNTSSDEVSKVERDDKGSKWDVYIDVYVKPAAPKPVNEPGN